MGACKQMYEDIKEYLTSILGREPTEEEVEAEWLIRENTLERG